MTWEISWADMCRACMEVEGELLALYNDDNEAGNDMPSKLAELAAIEINRSDGLPTKLCAKCAYKTNAFMEFKSLVRESDEKLRHMFDEQVISDLRGDQINDQISNKYIVSELQIEDEFSSVKDELNSSSNSDDKNDNTVLQSTETKIGDTVSVVEGLNKVCNTIILNVDANSSDVLGNNSEIQSLHVVFHSSDFDPIDNISETQFITNQNNCEIELANAVSHELEIDSRNVEESMSSNAEQLESEENIEVNSDVTEAFAQIVDEAIEDEMFEDSNIDTSLLQDNDSDSDCDTSKQENIVGSLNDTITKVKEIKEGGKVVQYQCTLCLQNYKVLSEALTHIVSLHVPSTGPFYCVVCEMDCDSIKHLKAHVKVHKGTSPYKCFLCNKSYVMKRYLKRHMACHTDFPRYRCTKCGERFKVKSELEAHISSHGQGAPFRCSQCPRVFNHKGNYKRHLISHLDPQGLHLPKYPCSICNRRFLNNRTLTTHMRVHTGEKPYKCDVCGKSFSQQGNLLNHQKIHSNPRSFTCEVCGKSFNQKATLRDHSLLHSGEKPYVCNVCGLAFTFTASLRRHMWTHSDGKPFECDLCDAKFIGRYDLSRHMKIHNGKPKLKRSKPVEENEMTVTEDSEEMISIIEDPSNPDTIFVEQIFLCDDPIEIISQDSEKENVDSLLGLIQYS